MKKKMLVVLGMTAFLLSGCMGKEEIVQTEQIEVSEMTILNTSKEMAGISLSTKNVYIITIATFAIIDGKNKIIRKTLCANIFLYI